MSYLKLLEYNFVDELQKQKIEQYLNKLTSNSIFTQSEFSYSNSLDKIISQKVLSNLCNDNILSKFFAIKCPECGYIIETIDDITNINESTFCVNCEDDVNITTDDILIIYKLSQSPFVNGQQINKYIQNQPINPSVALIEDTLSTLIKNGDANDIFYKPSDEEYISLQEKYSNIFSAQTNKEKGNTLEDLVKYLFNLCKHIRAGSINIKGNQIDCYARNILSVPFNLPDNIYQDFIVECKNENKKPSITYLNKIHSILKITHKRHGIIVSKVSAPTTHNDTARDIYLSDNILIIFIDKDDLYNIIFNKKNLLECIERKFNEVIINSKSNLINAGIYTA